jgi:uncharacterized repeat protein (TIGR01451 family)
MAADPSRTGGGGDYACYFAQDHATGVVFRGLPQALYRVRWWNPRTGSLTEQVEHYPHPGGDLWMPPAPSANDWVILVRNEALTRVNDVAITIDDGLAFVKPGGVTYTIRADNLGMNPSPVTATVTDAFPAGLSGMQWTCSASGGARCTGAGVGNILERVDLPRGGSVTFTATGAFTPGPLNTLSNAATIAADFVDDDPSNNTATDVDWVTIDGPSPGQYFYTLSPCRLVDTRAASGVPFGGPIIVSPHTRTFGLVGACGIPATARAVSLNIAVTQPNATGFVTLFPAGGATPVVSTINYAAGDTLSNNAIVPLSADGRLSAFIRQATAGTTMHLIIDVNGYFE